MLEGPVHYTDRFEILMTSSRSLAVNSTKYVSALSTPTNKVQTYGAMSTKDAPQHAS